MKSFLDFAAAVSGLFGGYCLLWTVGAMFRSMGGSPAGGGDAIAPLLALGGWISFLIAMSAIGIISAIERRCK